MADERFAAFKKYLEPFPKAPAPDEGLPIVVLQLIGSTNRKRGMVILDYDEFGILVKNIGANPGTEFHLWHTIQSIASI